MRLPFWRLLLTVFAMLVLLVAACADDENGEDGTPTGGDASPSPGAAAPSEMDETQTLRTYMTSEPETLDPQRATDTVSLSVLAPMYATWMRLDENLEVQPWLATEVPTTENGGVSEDGLTYTLNLRQDLKWSDGEPLVAQHFVDGARRLFDPGSENYYVDFYRVIAAPLDDGTDGNVEIERALAEEDEERVAELESLIREHIDVTAPDDHTVVYTLNRQSPVFTLLLTMWPLYPVRQDVIDQHGDAWTEAGNHISNGPFQLAEWRHNEDIVLTKNEHYHDAENVMLERIEVDQIADTNVAFLAYQNDEIDVVKLGPAELVQVRNDAALQEEFQSYAELVTLGAYFNLRHEPLQDINVRQALAMALDRDQLVENVLEGAAQPAYSWVPPGMPGYDEQAGLQYQDAEEQAAELMAEAGYDENNKLHLTILLSDSSTAKLIAEWIQNQWESKLPVEVSLDARETATYFSERNAGNYQVTTGGWGADYPDPQNWLPLFRSGGGLNSGGFSDAEFDALLEQADQELDNERRLEIYKDAQIRMLEQLPFAPMYHRSRQILVKPWVQGLVPNSMEHDIPGDIFLDRVYISGRE